MMGSRDKEQPASHHQVLSSLVVRPSSSDGGGGGGGGGNSSGGGGRGNDYEPGEVRREPPPYSRSERYSDDPGSRIHAGYTSPVRRRDMYHQYSPDFDHSNALPRGREFGGERDRGRFRDSSPPYGRGRGNSRPFIRGPDGPGFAHGSFRGEGGITNNPNVRPREGDWYCSDPACRNLNFARREYCNNCNKHRYAPGGSPQRGYPGPPPRRFPGPPMDRSPGRATNAYRSPPQGWARDGPRELGPGSLAPPRYKGKFSDHHGRRDRPDFPEDNYRGRVKFERPIPGGWAQRDRGRDNFFNDRRGPERRPPSPPPPPAVAASRDRFARDVRERSRSPIRGRVGGGPPVKDYRRDVYVERGRDQIGAPF